MFFLRRLHLQIYATIVASLILTVVLAGLVFAPFDNRLDKRIYEISGKLTWLALPPATASVEVQATGLRKLSKELGIQTTLFDSNRQIIGSFGRPAKPPRLDSGLDGWEPHRSKRHREASFVLKLPDNRWIVAHIQEFDNRRPIIGLILIFGTIAAAVGIGSYPLVRKLTGRLDRLQQGVRKMGEGDLAARVKVEGRDEIATLAESFNTSASRIEDLVSSNRALLANASHELRTPLSRIRLGIELLESEPSQKRKDALQQDIAELDTLIDEILMMSRLDSGEVGVMDPQTDLLGIVAEEASRFEEVNFQGEVPPFAGNEKLIRRLVRNLLSNASKYGKPPIEAKLSQSAEEIILTVSDAGPGIAADEREKIFQRFYRTPGRQNIEGYGLGLPLVRQIAELHGGTVVVLDKPGCVLQVTFKR